MQLDSVHLRTFFKSIGLFFVLFSPSSAHLKVGNLSLSNYWIRPGIISKNTAAYLTINNPSLEKDKLLKVACDVSTETELHNHINENGIMKMRPVDAIVVDALQVELKPGSLHIMLMGLKKDLNEGDHVKMQLTFEKTGSIDVNFIVRETAVKADPAI